MQHQLTRTPVLLAAAILFSLGVFLFAVNHVQAAVVCWDGGGAGDTNWNTAANWEADTQPGSADVATFDSTDPACSGGSPNNNVTVNADPNVQGINITNYTGTITQSAGVAVSIGSGGYVQSDISSTFSGDGSGSPGNIVILSGSFNHTNGSFTSTAGILETRNGNWTSSGGTFTHNSGTVYVNLQSSASYTVTAGTLTLANLHLDDSQCCNGRTITIAAGTTLVVTGTLTIEGDRSSQNRLVGPGVIHAQGNIIILDEGIVGDDTIALVITINGTGDQTITGIAAQLDSYLPAVTIDKDSGTLYLVNTISITDTYTYTKGTISSGSSRVVFSTSNPDNDFTITGSHTLGDVYFDMSNCCAYPAITIASGTTLTVDGTLTLNNSGSEISQALNGPGNIVAKGDIVTTGVGIKGDVIITINGTGSQSITGEGDSDSRIPGITIDKALGTLSFVDTIVIVGAYTYAQGALDFGISTIIFAITNGDGNFTITGSHALNNVTFSITDCCSDYVIDIASGTTLTVEGTLTLNSVNQPGHALNGPGSVIAQGALTTSGLGLQGGNIAVTLTGTDAQTITNGASGFPSGTVTINKSSGTATLAANWTNLTATGQDLTITSGTLDLAGFNLTVNDVLSVANGAALKLQGGETVTAGTTTINSGSTVIYNGTSSYLTALALGNTYSNLTFNGVAGVWEPNGTVTVSGALTLTNGTFDLDSRSLNNTSGSFDNTANGVLRLQGGETLTVFTNDSAAGLIEYDGAGTYASGLAAGDSYYNLTFSGSGSWTLDAALDVNNNLTVSAGTLDVSGTDHAITIAGDWTHSGGTFTAQGGTVTLDGTNQTINDANTWNNLAKAVTSAATLTFEASVAQTIAGTITLTGTSGNLLSLVSSSPGTQWSIAVAGISTASYLDVQDSNASGSAVAIQCLISTGGCVNSGNNTNWTFSLGILPASDTTSPGPVTNLSATPQLDGSVLLTWTNPTDTDFNQVRIYRSTTPDFTPNISNQITTTQSASYTDTNVESSTTYTYLLRTEDTNGNLQTGLFYPSVAVTTLEQTQEPTPEPETPTQPEQPFTMPPGLQEGDLIRGPDGIKVYVTSEHGYKRHIPNEDVFNMYGQFKWDSIQEVSQTTLDSFTTSSLIREYNTEPVYQVTSISPLTKHHLNMTPQRFEELGYEWKAVFIVNEQEHDYYATKEEIL